MLPAGNQAALLDETFAGLRRLMAAIRGRFHHVLAEDGLTFPQWMIMRAIHRRGRLTVRELADALSVTPANVTGIVDRLERDGLATRSRGTDDRRVVFVRLTERGHAKSEHLLGCNSRILGGLFDSWSDEDLRVFRDALARVNLRPEDALEF